MGLLAATAAGELFRSIGSLAKDIRAAVTGELPPEVQLKLAELEAKAAEAQAQINLMEAQSPRLFVAGWRPAIGWICAFALAWQFILHPLWVWAAAIWMPGFKPPVFQVGELYPLVLALLGLAGARTIEKINQVDDRR